MAERSAEPSPEPGIATAERGVVLIDGPAGTVAALTPEAAAEMGESLRRAASLAARQRADANGDEPVELHPGDGGVQ